ncbi:hypothetical protein WMF30_48245 [Sorangium sp. So ce134]
MKLTYLGTATLVIRIGETRLLTDPVLDVVAAGLEERMRFLELGGTLEL